MLIQYTAYSKSPAPAPHSPAQRRAWAAHAAPAHRAAHSGYRSSADRPWCCTPASARAAPASPLAVDTDCRPAPSHHKP